MSEDEEILDTMYHVEGHEFVIFERDDELWGRDDYGEFRLEAGSPTPVSDDDFDHYTPCGAVLKFWKQRYGERRYCTGMACSNFTGNPRGGSDFCKHHVGRENGQKMVAESFETGALIQSYKTAWQHLQPHQQAICIEAFHGFLDASVFDFDYEVHVERIDVEDIEWVEDKYWHVDFPVPTENVARARYLWVAALELCKMENIQERLLEDATDDDVGVGEREVTVYGEQGPVGTERQEHHLNLPLSRVIKDHSRLLEAGGVNIKQDGEGPSVNVERQWVTTIDAPDPEPEAIMEEDPFEKRMDDES